MVGPTTVVVGGVRCFSVLSSGLTPPPPVAAAAGHNAAADHQFVGAQL